jgi:hypothetical protein
MPQEQRIVKYSDIFGLGVIEPMLYKVCLAIEDQAVLLAPVDTGALRNSISIVTSARESGFNEHGGAELAPQDAKIGKTGLDADGYTAKVGSALVYAAAVEYGLPEKPGYPAQPYLRPAGELMKAKINKESTVAIKNAIKKLSQERFGTTSGRGQSSRSRLAELGLS